MDRADSEWESDRVTKVIASFFDLPKYIVPASPERERKQRERKRERERKEREKERERERKQK